MKNTLGNNPLAIVTILLATLCMALQDAIVKWSSSDLTLWQLFTIRGCIALIMLWVLLRFRFSQGDKWPINWFWSSLRSCLLVLMYISFYFALYLVDLSVAAGLYYTGPLFIVLFSWLLLKEQVRWFNLVSVVLGFIGVIVIIMPGDSDISVAIVLPILSAFFYALAMVTTKGKCQEESLMALVISLNVAFVLIGSLVSGLILLLDLPIDLSNEAPFLMGHWAPIESQQWAVLFMLAFINVAIHFLLAKAYKIGKPVIVAGFDYSYLVFAVFWGWLLLSEIPKINTLLGIVLIIGAGLLPIVIMYLSNSMRTGRKKAKCS